MPLKRSHHLSHRLLFYVILCSSLLTFVTTSIQLYLEYKKDFDSVQSSLEFIRNSYVPSIASSAYSMDLTQMRLQMKGALRLNGIKRLQFREVRGKSKIIVIEGEQGSDRGVTLKLPLIYQEPDGNSVTVGELTTIASYADIYDRLIDRIVIVFSTNAAKTFCAAFIILAIIQLTVTRHLKTMAMYAKTLDLNTSDNRLSLNRQKSKRPDELEEVVLAFNEMRKKIQLDLKAQKSAKKALEEEKEKFKMLLENLPQRIFYKDAKSTYLSCNRNFARAFKIEADEIEGKTDFDFFPKELAEKHRTDDKRLLQTGKTEEFEEELIENEQASWFHIVKTPVQENGGDIVGILGIFWDVTGAKLADDTLKASLKEKDALLKEIHHRVKNNMQVIISLLRLQSQNITDKRYADMFKESQDRIRSMSLVHEILYGTKNLAEVDFKKYIESLVLSLLRSYGAASYKINQQIEVEDVSLELESAIPCGLIINELVSNSLKYAFPEEN
ncbi:PAS domain-containing protein, partial [bacterium]|nr:PAS domain-containing protein [bacterium]